MAKNLRRTDIRLKIGVALMGLFAANAFAADPLSTFLPPQPESEFLSLLPDEPTVDFCSEWNPEFAYRGYRCCSNTISKNALVSASRRSLRRIKNSCAPTRLKTTFCEEMTDEQRAYIEGVQTGRIKDPLQFLEASFERQGQQAWCGASNGFLVGGKPLLMSPINRIELRRPERCGNFGTDRLVAMMEWTGREVHKEYHEPEFSQARVIVGDLSAPRGSCMTGRTGRRAHKSHTTGLDIDIAFFNPRFGHEPEERFTRNFYVASNWWLLKKMFNNPYACVKVVFLDARHKRILERFARVDPAWQKLSPFIRHIKGHKDHFHIRVGELPGAPGCIGMGEAEADEDIADIEVTPEGETTEESDLLPAGVADAGSELETEKPSLVRSIAQKTGELMARAIARSADAAPEEIRLAHKQEPAVTQQLESEMRSRSSRRRNLVSRRKTSRR